MAKKQERTYLIRGFDHNNVNMFLNPEGLIEDKPTFKEAVVKTQADALLTMVFDSTFKTMTVPSILDHADSIDIKGTEGLSTTSDYVESNINSLFSIIDIDIVLLSSDKIEIKNVKSELREIIKRWAEKSRIKGKRGFRLSAIKTPIFDYRNGTTIVRTQVILSNAIIYNLYNTDINPINVNFDIGLLTKKLSKNIDIFDNLQYNVI
jgi:hypothetical protein